MRAGSSAFEGDCSGAAKPACLPLRRACRAGAVCFARTSPPAGRRLPGRGARWRICARSPLHCAALRGRVAGRHRRTAGQPGGVWCAPCAGSGRCSQHGFDAPYPPGFASALARVRALCFYAVTVLLSLPLFVSMLLITPFQLAFDKSRRLALHFVNDLWACASTALFYRVEVRGAEHLPKRTEAAVYVANHQSYLDIYSLFHLRRPFKARHVAPAVARAASASLLCPHTVY